jgi:hypothetical protein
MKSFGKRVVAALLTGYIFFYYGECLFWATSDREGMGFAELSITWVVYSVFAYVFLCVVNLFNVRNVWAVFLAGAFFGWYEEGIVLQTTHGTPDNPLPMSIAWTALAWHALIDVFVGWYLVRWTLSQGSLSRIAALAGFIGIFYGLWSIFWWNEPPEPMKQLLDSGRKDLVVVHFATFSLVTCIILVTVHWLYDRLGPISFHPTRLELPGVALVTLIYFGLVTVPSAPIALAVIPIVMGVTLLALNRNRRVERRASAIACFESDVSAANYLCLLLIPFTAMAVQFIAFAGEISLRTNVAAYYGLSAVGSILWVLSLIVLLSNRVGHNQDAEQIQAPVLPAG